MLSPASMPTISPPRAEASPAPKLTIGLPCPHGRGRHPELRGDFPQISAAPLSAPGKKKKAGIPARVRNRLHLADIA